MSFTPATHDACLNEEYKQKYYIVRDELERTKAQLEILQQKKQELRSSTTSTLIYTSTSSQTKTHHDHDVFDPINAAEEEARGVQEAEDERKQAPSDQQFTQETTAQPTNSDDEFRTKELEVTSTIFEGESKERLIQWREVINSCISERESKKEDGDEGDDKGEGVLLGNPGVNPLLTLLNKSRNDPYPVGTFLEGGDGARRVGSRKGGKKKKRSYEYTS